MKDKIKEWIADRTRTISSVLEVADLDGEFDEALATIAHDCLTDTTPQWVSVDDELPKPWVCVLAFTKNSEYQLAQYEDNYWECFSDGHVVSSDITHWMPLPEPPK